MLRWPRNWGVFLKECTELSNCDFVPETIKISLSVCNLQISSLHFCISQVNFQLFFIQEIISSQAKKGLGNDTYVFLSILHFLLNGDIECSPSQHANCVQHTDCVCIVWIVRTWENCGKTEFKAISKYWLNWCWNSYVYHGIQHGPGLKHFPVVLLKTLIKPASALSFGKQPLRATGKEPLGRNHIVTWLDDERTKTVRHRKN